MAPMLLAPTPARQLNRRRLRTENAQQHRLGPDTRGDRVHGHIADPAMLTLPCPRNPSTSATAAPRSSASGRDGCTRILAPTPPPHGRLSAAQTRDPSPITDPERAPTCSNGRRRLQPRWIPPRRRDPTTHQAGRPSGTPPDDREPKLYDTRHVCNLATPPQPPTTLRSGQPAQLRSRTFSGGPSDCP
jgi:hypothetical protein